jgi:hypothetical protein
MADSRKSSFRCPNGSVGICRFFAISEGIPNAPHELCWRERLRNNAQFRRQVDRRIWLLSELSPPRRVSGLLRISPSGLTLLLTHDLRSTISVIIVAGACGIAASTPLAILGAIGQAAGRKCAGVPRKTVNYSSTDGLQRITDMEPGTFGLRMGVTGIQVDTSGREKFSSNSALVTLDDLVERTPIPRAHSVH